ncbi:MAG: hypothetical protein AAGD07_23305 [Planctomycetota bacterium]
MNPYSVGIGAEIGARDPEWPWLSPTDSRQARAIATDARRAAFSLLGALFLGGYGPPAFLFFFWIRRRAHQKLIGKHAQLTGTPDSGGALAVHFAKAPRVFTRWMRFYAGLTFAETVAVLLVLLWIA